MATTDLVLALQDTMKALSRFEANLGANVVPLDQKPAAIYLARLGSVRRECLDHLLIVGDRHLHRAIKDYVDYFNRARPHQGIGQRIPGGTVSLPAWPRRGRLIAVPVLNGLHHDYRRAV